jgi:uncharacterized protein (DUF1800 family)
VDETRSAIAHLYRRAGFGARPDELDAAVAQGYQATVERLLAGLSGPDSAGDQVAVPALTTAGSAQEELSLEAWWLDRLITTSTPLREKLTLLWSGHFASGFQKVRSAAWMYRQNQLFRTLGSGRFDELTIAVAQDPAMQIWLDTRTNVAAHPNENFARELMELFTVGLGNYSEDDVREVARCFTGWSFDRSTGAFQLRSRAHDPGTKTVLGQTGTFDGAEVIRLITRQPASSRFMVAKLWSHLAYPVTPSDPVVTQLVPGYQRDLDITNLVRAILQHPGFTSAAARTGLVKQPIEYVVGVGRAFGLRAAGAGRGPNLASVSRRLGQEPFNPPSVGGWPQNTYWLNTATSAVRLQFGTEVAASVDLSALSGLPAGRRADALAHQLGIDGWGQTTAAALGHVAGSPAGLVSLALSAPEYVLN